ncbi:MAG TPA: hypothetical protein VIP05_03095 [Burkholderiaceae bacterium]
MEPTVACTIVRECQAAFQDGKRPRPSPAELLLAVRSIRNFLESARPDARPIAQLQVDEGLLYTRTGVDYVMPFVENVERRLIFAARARLKFEHL